MNISERLLRGFPQRALREWAKRYVRINGTAPPPFRIHVGGGIYVAIESEAVKRGEYYGRVTHGSRYLLIEILATDEVGRSIQARIFSFSSLEGRVETLPIDWLRGIEARRLSVDEVKQRRVDIGKALTKSKALRLQYPWVHPADCDWLATGGNVGQDPALARVRELAVRAGIL